jgi:hypothetical protein
VQHIREFDCLHEQRDWIQGHACIVNAWLAFFVIGVVKVILRITSMPSALIGVALVKKLKPEMFGVSARGDDELRLITVVPDPSA